jgi:hypothetical protein
VLLSKKNQICSYSASTEKVSIQNLRLSCRSYGLFTPLGCVEMRKGLEGRGHRRWRRPRHRAVGHVLRRNPRKARFFAEQKMRPNFQNPCNVQSFYGPGRGYYEDGK